MRAFRPQIERLRDQNSCFRQSDAVIAATHQWAAIKKRSRKSVKRMSAQRSFRYRFASEQIVAVRNHEGAQSTLRCGECQRGIYQCARDYEFTFSA
jgi:hypothetical protein